MTDDVRLTPKAALRAGAIFQQLERHGYLIKDDADVETLALAYVDARLRVGRTANTYLRVLCANAQARLASTPDLDKASAEEMTELQRRALVEVHRKYYPIILRTITTPDIAKAPGCKPEERQRRARERNRRSNFARSSYSTLRKWVRTGHSLMELRVDRLTKRLLTDTLPAGPISKHQTPAAQSRNRRVLQAFERRADGLAALAERAIKADEKVAAPVLEKLAQRLFTVLSRHASLDFTTNKAQAIEDKKPWKSGDTVFLPLQTREGSSSK